VPRLFVCVFLDVGRFAVSTVTGCLSSNKVMAFANDLAHLKCKAQDAFFATLAQTGPSRKLRLLVCALNESVS